MRIFTPILAFAFIDSGCVLAQFIPLSFGADFTPQESYGEQDILRGFKQNVGTGESPFRRSPFTGTILDNPWSPTTTINKVVISDSDIVNTLEVEGSLSVSYGPISGSGAGRFLDDKVRTDRQVSIIYRTRKIAFARAVDAGTIELTPEAQGLTSDEFAEVYGTKFVSQIAYGAQLDIVYTVTSSVDIDIQEIEAELQGKIGVGGLAIEFQARFEQKEGTSQSDYQLSIEVFSSGVSVEVEGNPTFNQTNDIISDFNNDYDDLLARASQQESLDQEQNVLNQLSPLGLFLADSQDYFPAFNQLEVATLSTRMEELSDIFFTALLWRQRIVRAVENAEIVYSSPRERAEIFEPYRVVADGAIDRIDQKIEECLVFRRQPFEHIVGREGVEQATLPEPYPVNTFETRLLQGLTGRIFIPSPLSLGGLRFDGVYYVGYALPVEGDVFVPMMRGAVNRNVDDSVVATADSPGELGSLVFAIENDLEEGGFQYVEYNQKFHIQSFAKDDRWITGPRQANIGVQSLDKLEPTGVERSTYGETYEWYFRSDLNLTDAASFNGVCLKYGDVIYLQSVADETHYMAGSLHDGCAVSTNTDCVLVYDPIAKSGLSLTHFQWIVRSNFADGTRNAESDDPAFGECVQENFAVLLQNNYKSNRFLSSGRGLGNAGVDVRDIHSETKDLGLYEFDAVYLHMIRPSAGDGSRTHALFCGALRVHGKWVPLNFDADPTTLEYTEGVTFKDSEMPFNSSWFDHFLRPVGNFDFDLPFESEYYFNPWNETVEQGISGGFEFGTDFVGFVVGQMLLPSLKSALAESAQRRSMSLSDGQGDGRAWQWVYEIEDVCGSGAEIRTAEIVFTASSDNVPCCPPGFFDDPSEPHGSCLLGAPCLEKCGAVCTPPATFLAPERTDFVPLDFTVDGSEDLEGDTETSQAGDHSLSSQTSLLYWAVAVMLSVMM